MNTKQKCISEIIKELESHPDYIYSEIFTWSDTLNCINDCLIDEDYDEIYFQDLTENQKNIIKNGIVGVVTYGYNYSSPFPHQYLRDEKNNFKIIGGE
jgi:hypothetical protein